MGFDKIKRTVDNTLELIRSSFYTIFAGFLKIQLLSMAVVAVPILIMIGAYLLLLTRPSLPLIIIAAGVGIIALLATIVGAVASGVISSTMYNFVDSAYKKMPFKIIEQAKTNLLPLVLYAILIGIITFIASIPFYIISTVIRVGGMFATVFAGGPIATFLVGFVAGFIGGIGASIVHLFLQFSIFELLVAKRDIIESFKKSFDYVKNNFAETFVFSLLVWLVNSVISIVLLAGVAAVAVLGIISLGFGLDEWTDAMGAVPLVGWVLIAIIGIPIFIFFGVVMNLIETTAQYNYWKELTKFNK